MTAVEPAVRTTGYPAGWRAGHHAGTRDGAGELDGTYQRDPDHGGRMPDGVDEDWVDGFLDGYALGRVEGMRGGA